MDAHENTLRQTFGEDLGALIHDLSQKAALLAMEDGLWNALLPDRWSRREPMTASGSLIHLSLTAREAYSMERLGVILTDVLTHWWEPKDRRWLEIRRDDVQCLRDRATEELGLRPACLPPVYRWCRTDGFPRCKHADDAPHSPSRVWNDRWEMVPTTCSVSSPC